MNGEQHRGESASASSDWQPEAKGGWIDLQVNGYSGVDFNADGQTPSQFRAACTALRADGVSQILATIITDSVAKMTDRLHNIAQARKEDRLVADVITGVHIEGPFLSPEPGYIGAHPKEHAMPANLDAMQQMFEASQGLTRIVTLAPEQDPGQTVTGWLVEQGITVSAGHCNPSQTQLADALDAGLSMFTHLGNGCPLLLHRHDNIIQRTLAEAKRLSIGFIADGIHVPFVALRNYLDLVGLERAFIVTDAISAAGLGPGNYTLSGHRVVVDEHLATWVADRSHLVGSAMTMPRVQRNLIDVLGLTAEQADRLTRINPARAIGFEI